MTNLQEWLCHKNPEIKKNLIYNIPYLINILPNKEKLTNLYLKAIRDNNIEIRLAAASSFFAVEKNKLL